MHYGVQTIVDVIGGALDAIDAAFLLDELVEEVKARLSELPDECLPEKVGK